MDSRNRIQLRRGARGIPQTTVQGRGLPGDSCVLGVENNQNGSRPDPAARDTSGK